MSWVPHQSYIMVAKRAKQGIKGSLPSWASPPLVLHTVKYTNLTCTIQRMYHITNIPIKRKYSHNSSKLLVSSSTQKITMVLTGSQCFGLFFHGLLLPAFEIHINGFIQGVFICVWTLSLNIIILRFIHVIDSMHHLFFFFLIFTKQYSAVWIYQNSHALSCWYASVLLPALSFYG